MTDPADRAAAYAEAAMREGLPASEAVKFAVEAVSGTRAGASPGGPAPTLDPFAMSGGGGFLTLGAMVMRARAKPETSWIIPGLLPAGLTIIAGAPKLGKSAISLDIAFSVAAGGKALGTLATNQCATLYLALEDHDTRIDERLRSLEPNTDRWPLEAMSVVTMEDLTSGGLRPVLDRWHNTMPNPGLVILDTLGSYKNLIAATPAAQELRKMNPYDADVSLLRPLQKWSLERGVALMLVHHSNQTRWEEGDDWMTKISGTSGIIGTADNVILVKGQRGEPEAELLATGRDLQDLAADMHRAGLWWTVTGGVAQ